MKKNLRTFAACFAILLFAVLSLSACGGTSKASDFAAAQTMAETTAAAAYAVSPSSRMSEVYSEKSETAMGSDSVLGRTGEVTSPDVIGRKLIRTVNLSVETDDFETLLTKLQEQITALSGYVEQSDISGKSLESNYSRRRAYMTVRIPSSSLNQFISSVETNGNITNKTETTTDVTLQYSDLESKKKSLSIEQDRIWALLEKADTIESIIALEERLSEIRYELESMESKLRLYDNQVEYSTVHINIEEVKIYTPTKPESVAQRIQRGVSGNLENVKEFSVNLFVLLVSSSPIWIPVLGICLVILFIIRRKSAGKKVNTIVSGLSFSFDQENKHDQSTSGTDADGKN